MQNQFNNVCNKIFFFIIIYPCPVATTNPLRSYFFYNAD